MTVYILLGIYLICLYFAYKGATNADYNDFIGDDLDEQDLDESENFYHKN